MVSTLSTLTATEFINKNFITLDTNQEYSILERVEQRHKLLNELRAHQATREQLDFARAVSLNDLLKLILKKTPFPTIKPFSYNTADHVAFEPVLNLNLFNLNLQSLERSLDILNKNSKQKQLVDELISEKNLIKERISYIENIIDQTPKILSTSIVVPITVLNPKVSIITASFNLAPFVEETLRSVVNQDSDQFEHIVIDGGSSDESLALLRKYPHIILVSEKDAGYPDAFWKGVKLAKGEYILQCAISDGYATTAWLKHCIETLDNNPDISLVWGFPGRLTEGSKFIAIARPQFHYILAPQKEKMFSYWLKNSFVYPEGNLCTRKSVLLKCYPTVKECEETNILDWLEFSYRFNRLGYISEHIPVLANFGRSHGNQLGEVLANIGKLKSKYKNYRRKIFIYRLRLLLGLSTHKFIDQHGHDLDLFFDKKSFFTDYTKNSLKNMFKINKKYFKVTNYVKYIKRSLK